MIPVPSGVRVWLSSGVTDMRRGMNGLSLQVQEALGRDPVAGDLYVFRGRRGNLIKVLWHDGQGFPGLIDPAELAIACHQHGSYSYTANAGAAGRSFKLRGALEGRVPSCLQLTRDMPFGGVDQIVAP